MKKSSCILCIHSVKKYPHVPYFIQFFKRCWQLSEKRSHFLKMIESFYNWYWNDLRIFLLISIEIVSKVMTRKMFIKIIYFRLSWEKRYEKRCFVMIFHAGRGGIRKKTKFTSSSQQDTVIVPRLPPSDKKKKLKTTTHPNIGEKVLMRIYR